MAVITRDQLQPFSMGHLGLAGAFIRETKIIEMIDFMIPKSSNNSGHFTHGQVVALMILNGVGYTTRPLYMSNTFFDAKDVEAMLGIKYEKAWFNDDVIAHTMDALYEYGLTPLFSEVALEVMKRIGCKIGSVNVDSTSFHYHGKEQMYHDDNTKVDYDVPHKINVTYGYSRDAHPELVQIMEQMIVDNATGIPLYMEPESGNTNDSNAFKRMIQTFESFKKYTDDGYVYLCGDSALYSEDNVTFMAGKGIKFVTRVADGNRNSVQEFIAEHRNDALEKIDDVNQGRTYAVNDCGVNQTWLLVHSNSAEARNIHSVDSSAEKEKNKLQKLIAGYGKTYYACEPDAQKELDKFSRKCHYCKVVSSGIIKEEVPRRGRKPKNPIPDSEKEFRYKLDIVIDVNKEYCDMVKRNRSFFVVATNDTERKWTPEELLKQYKSQNRVERGFRFLKDPQFFADSIFVSKNEHIQALLMIMTLGLLVFSGLEWKLRNAMATSKVLLKNQIGKLTDKITMRYVFQIFSAIMTIILENGERLFYHISDQAYEILELLGERYQRTYGA
jgi:transposase